MSIIFVLDTNLEVYTTSSVNNEFWLCYSVLRKQRGLGLPDKFELLWQEMYSTINHRQDDHHIDGFYFLIGSKASFTDTRVIYIWLQTWSQFHPNNHFYIHKITDSNLKTIQASHQLLMAKAKAENNQILVYSQEPRIG